MLEIITFVVAYGSFHVSVFPFNMLQISCTVYQVLTNLLGIELGGGRDLAPEVLVLIKISGPTLGCSDWWIFVYTSKDVTRRYTF